ncbi:ion transporter [Sediminibacillus albus]|uniref:Voltage-gated sodium channel n=1 Tax=Sediminibacillus albus TaxID=407036 RepID=A0A1G9AQA7_9BACI|nr:ion transporter [Sediminibacillus albus]SDK28984.1 voltage-gated sodium channel [Sediminibacillus albus]
MSNLKNKCFYISQHPLFTNLIVGLIIINAILIGLETYSTIAVQYTEWLYISDKILLWIFTLEIGIRLIGSRTAGDFFKDPWSIFDFIIVMSGHLLVGAYYVTVLRILRILRVLRAISVIPSLRRMVNALLLTIPSMGTILMLLSIFFYIYGVIGTMLYSQVAPEYFGTLHASLLTLFQVVTLESWASGVMRPILAEEPSSWWFFVSFILIGTFVIFNLFVGVIVNNVEEANKEGTPDPTDIKLDKLQAELTEIKKLLKDRND